jgi:hypothetical protein
MRLRDSTLAVPTTLKGFLVALAGAMLLAQLFAISHEITVRHVRCAEHGELTDLAPSSFSVPTPALGPRTASLRSLPVETLTAHDHCNAAFPAQGGSPTSISRGAIRAPLAVAAGPRRGEPPRTSRARVLALAPKTSPPVG